MKPKPDNIYLLKVKIGNTRKRCKIDVVLMFLLLIFNKYMLAIQYRSYLGKLRSFKISNFQGLLLRPTSGIIGYQVFPPRNIYTLPSKGRTFYGRENKVSNCRGYLLLEEFTLWHYQTNPGWFGQCRGF